MAKELNEDSGFKVSIKTLIAIGFAMATVIGMWFALQADIEEAKELPVPPPPDVTRMEFDMKDKNIRLTIENTQEDVEYLKNGQERMQEDLTMIKKQLLSPDDGAIARINKNTDFRNKTQKVLWSIWIALLGIIGKMIFWD